MRPNHVLALLALPLAAAPLSAQALILQPHATFDVSAASIGAFGDVAIERNNGRLWIADAAPGGVLHEFAMASGAYFGTVDPSVIPGLDQGPEALAVGNGIINPPLDVFSSIGESEGGRISQGGNLIADFANGHVALGADVDANGELWVVGGTIASGTVTLRRIDPATGAALHTVTIAGATPFAVDVAFDPLNNDCYVLFEDGTLRRVLTTNGSATFTTAIGHLLNGAVGAGGGFDFDVTGEFVWIAMGDTPGTSGTVTVLRRQPTFITCSSFTPGHCPCDNAGQPGHGCANSVHALGAGLVGSGVSSRTNDTLVLEVRLVPPGASSLLFQGTAAAAGGGSAFGDGHLCVGGTIVRLGVQNASSESIAEWPRPGDPPLSVSGLLPATGAVTRHYQVWYRNAAPAFCTEATFNLSNGVRVEWY